MGFVINLLGVALVVMGYEFVIRGWERWNFHRIGWVGLVLHWAVGVGMGVTGDLIIMGWG